MRTLYTIPLLALLAAGATAEDSLTKQLRGCSTIKDNSERLACYDALSKTLDKRAEQIFGQEQQRIAEEAPESIDATIAEVQKIAYGKLLITLDNGQVWRQNDSGRVHWKGGDTVTLERGLFGSFFMKAEDGGRKIRVKRVQ
ncbi:hypothetical protein [Microbulbifer taiwanensis]|uniref:Uncharacterized protein n=1 Tax=Microbulbifer taiwanensis TaxID=986746 RepID=A0ABW1YL77_9GAMM|nr:hypothetical protein [Microbulbifer taiwanensis]